MEAVKIVQKFFPKVAKVVDATKPITVEVTQTDNKSSKVLNHTACALAVACKRTVKADGVIISLGRCYVISGTVATRYFLQEHASREIVSFDRDAGFGVGEYELIPPPKNAKLGHRRGGETSTKGNGTPQKRKHFTTGIRTTLGRMEVGGR